MKLTHVRLLVDEAGFADCFRVYRDTLGLKPAAGHLLEPNQPLEKR